MRKWFAFGIVAAVGVIWYFYLSSLRAEHTGSVKASKAAADSAPPLAAKPAAPVPIKPAHPSAPAQQPVARAADPAPPEPDVVEPISDRNALFATRFDSETRDAFWANDQEPALKKQLTESTLTDDDVSAVECRRTVCRVTFKNPRVNESQAINLYSRVLTTFADVQLAMHDATSAEPAHFYALRKGYTLNAK